MTDKHVQAVIDNQKRTATELTTGQQLTPDQVTALIKARPDIATEFQRASGAADPNSPVFKQKGLDSLNNFAQYWYDSLASQSEKDAISGVVGSNKPDPTKAATDATNAANNTTTDLLNSTRTTLDNTTSLINGTTSPPPPGVGVDALGYPIGQPRDLTKPPPAPTGATDPNGGLLGQVTGLIGDLTNKFTSAQTDLLKGLQDAQSQQTSQMQDLVKSMLSVGQSVKQPNYASALARNKQLNSGGLGSTMLTGPTGVSPGAMTLGFTNLLGGATK